MDPRPLPLRRRSPSPARTLRPRFTCSRRRCSVRADSGLDGRAGPSVWSGRSPLPRSRASEFSGHSSGQRGDTDTVTFGRRPSVNHEPSFSTAPAKPSPMPAAVTGTGSPCAVARGIRFCRPRSPSQGMPQARSPSPPHAPRPGGTPGEKSVQKFTKPLRLRSCAGRQAGHAHGVAADSSPRPAKSLCGGGGPRRRRFNPERRGRASPARRKGRRPAGPL